MSNVAHLPIVADRYGACVRQIYLHGLDLTGVAMRAQVRLGGDVPGAPLVDLLTVTNGNAEGLRLVEVTAVAGLPTSHVELVINETTMEALPYMGEMGSATSLAWDWQVTLSGRKQRVAAGAFVITGDGVTGANAAPTGRTVGWSTMTASGGMRTGATLSFGDDVVAVTVDGANLLAPLVHAAEAARDAVKPLFGDGAPAAELGIIGSTYFDVAAPSEPIFYGPKTGAGWGAARTMKGNPGGNVMAIGLFSGASGLDIPGGTDMVRTSGHSVVGWGAADYVADPAVDAAYVTINPRTAFISNNARGFRLMQQGTLRPSQFGARATAGIDDTAALATFFRHPADLLEGDAGATYQISVPDPAAAIFRLDRGLLTRGNGATIRFADGVGEWTLLWGNLDRMVDLSGVDISGWTIDCNAMSGPAPVLRPGEAVLARARHVVYIKRGKGFRFRGNVIRRHFSTNAVVFSGDGNTRDGLVEGCTFEGIGATPGKVYHDHSTIYLTGDDTHARRNIFRSSGWGIVGATCAIEMHPGQRYSVEDNDILGYHTGINIAGVYEADSIRGSVHRNTVDVLRRGIAIYSDLYLGHTTGFGINDLQIDNNRVHIRNTAPRGDLPAGAGGPGMFGILRLSGARLPTRGIRIGEGNKVSFEVEAGPALWDGVPIGVGTAEVGGVGAESEDDGFWVGAMEIENCPGIALMFGQGGGVLRNCGFSDGIRLIRPGSAGDTSGVAGFVADYRVGWQATPRSFAGSFKGGMAVIVDDFAVTRLHTACAVGAAFGGASPAVAFDLEVTGDRAAFSRSVRHGDPTIRPRVQGRQNFPFLPPVGDVEAESAVRDCVSAVDYLAPVHGSAWKRRLTVTELPAGSFEADAEIKVLGRSVGQPRRYVATAGGLAVETTLSAGG